MKNYTDSDYAANEHSKHIVYCFSDGKYMVTLEDYLSENPDMTELDFIELKTTSDKIYYEQVCDENAQTKKNITLNEIEEITDASVHSLEESYITAINAMGEARKLEERYCLAAQALDKAHRSSEETLSDACCGGDVIMADS